MHKLFRIQFLVLMVVIVLFTTYAFASNETGLAPGGEGANTISGWNVSNIHYGLTDDPSKISLVEFDLDGSADSVNVSLDSSTPRFFSCENNFGTHWVCNVNSAQIHVSDVNEVRVVALGQ